MKSAACPGDREGEKQALAWEDAETPSLLFILTEGGKPTRGLR